MEEPEIARFKSFEEFFKSYQLGKIWLLLKEDFSEAEVHKNIENKLQQCQMDIVIIGNDKYWLINR